MSFFFNPGCSRLIYFTFFKFLFRFLLYTSLIISFCVPSMLLKPSSMLCLFPSSYVCLKCLRFVIHFCWYLFLEYLCFLVSLIKHHSVFSWFSLCFVPCFLSFLFICLQPSICLFICVSPTSRKSSDFNSLSTLFLVSSVIRFWSFISSLLISQLPFYLLASAYLSVVSLNSFTLVCPDFLSLLLPVYSCFSL